MNTISTFVRRSFALIVLGFVAVGVATTQAHHSGASKANIMASDGNHSIPLPSLV